jgi:hypothetical protein
MDESTATRVAANRGAQARSQKHHIWVRFRAAGDCPMFMRVAFKGNRRLREDGWLRLRDQQPISAKARVPRQISLPHTALLFHSDPVRNTRPGSADFQV